MSKDENIVDLDDERYKRKATWKVAERILCFHCGKEWVGVIDSEAHPAKLECPRCKRSKGVVMQWQEP